MNYDCRNRFYRGGRGGVFRAGLILLLGVGLAQGALADRTLNDDELRSAAIAAGLGPLQLSDVPDMSHLDKYVKNETALKALGKALFWDMQVGGDGIQACASCHFVAGADPRSINQLSPGILAGDNDFEPKANGPGGPNYQLVQGDFPFYEVSPGTDCPEGIDVDSGDPALEACKGGKFDNDVVSSAGVFFSEFVGFSEPGEPAPDCDAVADPDGFSKANGFDPLTYHNTRRVEPRNTPTVINAVFNHRNFWDGRANNFYNGVNPLGLRGQLKDGTTYEDLKACSEFNDDPNVNGGNQDPTSDLCGLRDTTKAVWKYSNRKLTPYWPLEKNSSLASQASGPPGSVFEMSCGENRSFPDLGRQMIYRFALANQTVDSTDPVLGSFRNSQGPGLSYRYSNLIMSAFNREWWGKTRGFVPGTEFKQMEMNFSLFFGLAVQAYEATLVANQTPFDEFMTSSANNDAMTEHEKEGLEVFISGDAKCVLCHAGPELTGASVRERALPVPPGEPMERMLMGNNLEAVYDGGFYNIGVRATNEDLCVGDELAGFPLSFSAQASEGRTVDPESRTEVQGDNPGPIVPDERVAVRGACKTPTVRLTSLTAPYFHSGQSATLLGVVDHYAEQFRELFSVENIDDLDPDILDICTSDTNADPHPCELDEVTGEIADGEVVIHEGIRIDDRDVAVLVKFMDGALTDDRVVHESDVFSRPAICIPVGHDEPIWGDPDEPLEAAETLACLPATGAAGGPAVQGFLGIDQGAITVP